MIMTSAWRPEYFSARVWVIALVCLNVVNVWFALRSRTPQSPWTRIHRVADDTTYLGSNFPYVLPWLGAGSSRSIQQPFNASSHYPLMGEKSDKIWNDIAPKGAGVVQLGSDARLFGLDAFHELHCLRALNLAFGGHPSATIGHVHHCINYLHTMALCAADTTVEAGDFVTDGPDEQAQYTCADTTALYQWLDDNFDHWNTEL